MTCPTEGSQAGSRQSAPAGTRSAAARAAAAILAGPIAASAHSRAYCSGSPVRSSASTKSSSTSERTAVSGIRCWNCPITPLTKLSACSASGSCAKEPHFSAIVASAGARAGTSGADRPTADRARWAGFPLRRAARGEEDVDRARRLFLELTRTA
nr:hypothetical protein OG781_40045 [Streptomyces sp. NBC_00830]